MGDTRGEVVPKHKLTKEQVAFSRKFKKMLEIKYFLDSKSLILKNELKDIQELYRGLGQGFSKLQPPQEGVRELDGMNFGEQTPSDMQIQR